MFFSKKLTDWSRPKYILSSKKNRLFLIDNLEEVCKLVEVSDKFDRLAVIIRIYREALKCSTARSRSIL